MSETPWYKDAVIYEIRVRAFADSNGDGIGDFRGLADKLDYLADLGVTALWLLPFYPSPLRDDGYDISDYLEVHPACGTLADFKYFLREAHRRGLKVITELVINHTSDQHPWFQRARQSPAGSRWRNFYVWNDTPNKYQDARIIFKDYEHSNWSWDPVAKAYYWHRFFNHQPDLNFDNPEVKRAISQVMDTWLGMGVDGLRLDAVPYLIEREGTNCENLSETHNILRDLRRHVDKKYQNRMFLAEANQWPEDAVAYFGKGDECHMAFHFPIMPRMFMALHMEDRYPITDILEQTPEIPETCQWALFLRNHDELTLEMVTDEERDYMYRVYAHDPEARINLGIRRRLAPLLGNNRRKIELMNGLLFSMPGTPVLYYGDEIGMGDNIYLGDRNSVRTPMQWSGDRNAGFSRANPQKLYLPINIDPEYHYEAINVEAQQNNPHSLYWWTKRLIALRKRFKSFGHGSIEFLKPANTKVLTFIRRFDDETILVVANLSRFVQYVELDLSAYKDMRPIELFGRVEFPPIGDLPYFITLGPHGFYWFQLRPARLDVIGAVAAVPAIGVTGRWDAVFSGKNRGGFEDALSAWLMSRRWFGGKGRSVNRIRLTETVPIMSGDRPAALAVTTVEYTEGQPDLYLIAVAFCTGERRDEILREFGTAVIARLTVAGKGEPVEGILYDALMEAGFSRTLLDAIPRRRQFKGTAGIIRGVPTRAYRAILGKEEKPLDPHAVKGEQSNSSVVFGETFIMKLFRRFERGVNPDLEMGLFLTERSKFPNTPNVAGYLEYDRPGHKEPMTVAILQAFVPSHGDAWQYTLDELGRYFEKAVSSFAHEEELPLPPSRLADRLAVEVPSLAAELLGPYLESARLLGQRTAELHLALSGEKADKSFAPEPLSPFNQRALYQAMRGYVAQNIAALRKKGAGLRSAVKRDAQKVLKNEDALQTYLKNILKTKLTSTQIRCHGDFHLGQVLYTGRDFIIIDFEGEPARPLSERRLKRSPLRDIAGMLRSFDYAAYAALHDLIARGTVARRDAGTMDRWARFWTRWAAAIFERAYLERAGNASFIPGEIADTELLLNAFLIEKAVYEINYEVNNRPDWVRIPMRGLLDLLDGLK